MKTWEKAFKWIGVVAVVAFLFFAIQQYQRTANYKVGLQNFVKTVKESGIHQGQKITDDQRNKITLAAKNVGVKPIIFVDLSRSKAFGTIDCSNVHAQILAGLERLDFDRSLGDSAGESETIEAIGMIVDAYPMCFK